MNRRGFFASILALAAAPLLKFVPESDKVTYVVDVDQVTKTVTISDEPWEQWIKNRDKRG